MESIGIKGGKLDNCYREVRHIRPLNFFFFSFFAPECIEWYSKHSGKLQVEKWNSDGSHSCKIKQPTVNLFHDQDYEHSRKLNQWITINILNSPAFNTFTDSHTHKHTNCKYIEVNLSFFLLLDSLYTRILYFKSNSIDLWSKSIRILSSLNILPLDLVSICRVYFKCKS